MRPPFQSYLLAFRLPTSYLHPVSLFTVVICSLLSTSQCLPFLPATCDWLHAFCFRPIPAVYFTSHCCFLITCSFCKQVLMCCSQFATCYFAYLSTYCLLLPTTSPQQMSWVIRIREMKTNEDLRIGFKPFLSHFLMFFEVKGLGSGAPRHSVILC